MKTITIHRLIQEIKLTQNKLVQAAIPTVFIVRNKKPEDTRMTVEEQARQVQSVKDSFSSLAKRLPVLKSALILSNAKTTLKVGAEEMTVAEALSKKEFLPTIKSVLDAIFSQAATVMGQVEKKNTAEEAKIVEILKSKTEADSNQVQALTEMLREANLYSVNDPGKILDWVKEKRQEIELFESEVDSALSESNATTTVDIDD